MSILNFYHLFIGIFILKPFFKVQAVIFNIEFRGAANIKLITLHWIKDITV